MVLNLKRLIIILFFIMNLQTGYSQEVLTLNEGESPAKANLSQFEWLTGYWTGTGLGGVCEELWLPHSDNSMHGIFKMSKDGEVQFSEYMILVEEAGTVTLKLKHFSRDLTPWEEKEKWVEFRLVKLEGETAFFSGLTYMRSGNDLSVSLRMRAKGKTWTEKFSFSKTGL